MVILFAILLVLAGFVRIHNFIFFTDLGNQIAKNEHLLRGTSEMGQLARLRHYCRQKGDQGLLKKVTVCTVLEASLIVATVVCFLLMSFTDV